MPVILATQEAEIRRMAVQPRQIVHETLSQKTLSQKIGLVEWFKVKVLGSSPSTANKQTNKHKNQEQAGHSVAFSLFQLCV
jgi:hypothetical protein